MVVWAGMRAPSVSAVTTGASASMTRPGKTPASRQSAGEGEHRARARSGRPPRPARPPALRGRPRKVMPNALTKQAAASAAESASMAPTAGTRNLRPHCGRSGLEQDRLEGQPLGDEAVERRQRRDRGAADQEGEGGQRHAVDQAAQVLHVALAGRGQHGAGAEEQQALEQRVIEDVEQRRGQRQRRREAHAVGLEGERQAEADEDDADVLDRVVGEQPLQVVLHQRIEHAEHRGDAAERQHHHAPPPGGRARAGRRRCARSRRPRPWSSPRSSAPRRGWAPPDGRAAARRAAARGRPWSRRRAAPGPGPAADEAGRQAGAPDRGEGVAAARAGEQAEGEQQRQRAEARHDQIDVAGLRVALARDGAP